MKKINPIQLLSLIVTSLVCLNCTFATDAQNDIKMLKSFYSQYITNILDNKKEANKALKEDFFLPVLVGEIEEMNDRSGSDNVVRAQDAIKDMLNTLEVSSLGNDWYMVSYKTPNRNEEIPVKVTHRDGKSLIEYIIPETLGNKYGDEYINKKVNQDDAASGIKMLQSFCARYITNIQENKDEANKDLKSECISPEVLAWLPAFTERQGFDPIINAQDVNETMLNSLKVEPLERPDWYMVNYSWDGKDKTSIVVKLESINQKWRMSHIVPFGKK